MNKQPLSIYNDVLGPIMRGPSSSHTAAAVRIGRLVRQFMQERCRSYSVEFETKGSLATTYISQGSDIGLVGGLLGMETADPGLVNALDIARSRGLAVSFNIVDYAATHPNTYRIRAEIDDTKDYSFIFISTGGGMIELKAINEIPVTIIGDFYETLLFFEETEPSSLEKYKVAIEQLLPSVEYCLVSIVGKSGLIDIKTRDPLPEEMIKILQSYRWSGQIAELSPVLPLQSRKGCNVPFSTAEGVLAAVETERQQLFELALNYECARGDLTSAEVIRMGEGIITVMRKSIKEGMEGSDYSDRILKSQAIVLDKYQGKLFGGSQIKRVITYITAIMETKSAMGLIVAAPTAGSCAGLPGTVLAAADELALSDQTVLEGLLAAGLIGVLIASKSTFAAEECGCQAECGSSSSMTAAALVQMAGGNVKQALAAASIALQNIMGLVCDPVANRVEVPCLGKNVLAGMNAIASADMALVGYDPVIPLDETIAAFDQVGRMLPAELRCTGMAGLSTTPTSRALADRLNQRSPH